LFLLFTKKYSFGSENKCCTVLFIITNINEKIIKSNQYDPVIGIFIFLSLI